MAVNEIVEAHLPSIKTKVCKTPPGKNSKIKMNSVTLRYQVTYEFVTYEFVSNCYYLSTL